MARLYEIEEVKGYKENILKRILYYILVIASFGIVYLLARWSTRLWALLRVTECEAFIADYFIVRGSDQIKCIVPSEQFIMGGLRHIVLLVVLCRDLSIDSIHSYTKMEDSSWWNSMHINTTQITISRITIQWSN